MKYKMQRNVSLVEGETYHIYNRGAHKQPVFIHSEDYERFMLLMFLVNDDQSLDFRDRAKNYKGRTFVNMYSNEKPSHSLVDILAFCLMPNHFHLVVRQKAEDGISKFMRKLCTAYSMYFNNKHDHSGVLFQGKYKSKHVNSEEYFRYIFSYVHLNPLDIFDSSWNTAGMNNKAGAKAFMDAYLYSSYYDLYVARRVESAILGQDLPDFIYVQNDFNDLLKSYAINTEGDAEITKVRPL